MNKHVFLYPGNLQLFKDKVLQWAASFDAASYFDSCGYSDPYSAFDTLIAAGVKRQCYLTQAAGAFSELRNFMNEAKGWVPGFMSYDLKNDTENLRSENPDHLKFPELFFFVPEHLILIRGNEVTVHSNNPGQVISSIEKEKPQAALQVFAGHINQRLSREEYVETVNLLKGHISRGDIYEANFCQEFYAEDSFLDPVNAFRKLSKISPVPFLSFFRCYDKFILSASPERFLCRRGNKIISQPIKGTAKRSKDAAADQKLKYDLQHSMKERSENIMIVDLVRNDLTKCAEKGSVNVDELCGIYSFSQVHQMVSTVSCIADPSFHNSDIVKSTFPMGSMTGAPKMRAMELIEHCERTKRGIFSGTIGYFSPDGNFDFNVVIRTLLYNKKERYLSFQTGSAITFDSDPLQEYEECLLKAKAINLCLGM